MSRVIMHIPSHALGEGQINSGNGRHSIQHHSFHEQFSWVLPGPLGWVPKRRGSFKIAGIKFYGGTYLAREDRHTTGLGMKSRPILSDDKDVVIRLEPMEI